MPSRSEINLDTISQSQTVAVAPIPILLLEEEPDPLPKWMSYYAPVSNVLYGIHIIFSWVHLAFLRYVLQQQLLHIQFEPVYNFLAYNSYSILTPLLCTLGVLIYHVRRKVTLDDGDFFGLLGVMVLLCLVICYDATGVYHIYEDTSEVVQKDGHKAIQEDPLETNELSWQYAWSTKPTCARVHARMNLEKIERQKIEDEKMAPVMNPIVHLFYNGETDSWMYSGLSRSDLENGFLSATVPPEDSDKTADEIAYESEEECNKTADSAKPIEEPRDWMMKMHAELKCCGPFGRDQWESKVQDLSSCQGFKEGCLKRFHQYLLEVFQMAIFIMYLECVLYVMSMILAVIHYAAMKYEKTRIAKEYSLLNINEEGVTVIDVVADEPEKDNRRGSLVPRGLAYDPVHHLYNQSNRGHRRSIVPNNIHFPAALTLTITNLMHTKESPQRRGFSSHHGAGSRRHSNVHLLGMHHSPHSSKTNNPKT